MHPPTHSHLLPLGRLNAHLFARDYGHENERIVVSIDTHDGNFSTKMHLTADECEALGLALDAAAEWMRAAPARAAEALEQEQRDQIAGGERVPVTSSERGQFDAAALRMVREEGVLA